MNFLVYIKKCTARSISWVYLPLQIGQFTLLLATFLKVYGIKINNYLIFIFGLFIFLLLVYLGHLDIKYKMYNKELKIEAENNPFLTEILKNVKNKRN